MVFYVFCWAPREVFKHGPERRAFQPSRGAPQMLMHRKNTFDRYYCIIQLFHVKIWRNYPDFATEIMKGARWRSGRASDSESRGPGFDPHKRHRVVSLSKTH